MAYFLNSISIRTDNSQEGMMKINEVWQDIMTGKLPLLLDSEQFLRQGISPVSRYSNFGSDEKGAYDLTIFTVTSDFFKEMEILVSGGKFKKYEESGGDINECTMKAWEKVWQDQKAGKIKRIFTEDYESTVPPQYTKDQKAHCYLYIAVK